MDVDDLLLVYGIQAFIKIYCYCGFHFKWRLILFWDKDKIEKFSRQIYFFQTIVNELILQQFIGSFSYVVVVIRSEIRIKDKKNITILQC